MIIKLIGALPPRLKDMKLKPGDKFNVEPMPGTNQGAVQFQLEIDDEFHICTVWPQNYIQIG